jgi:peptidoglycan/LPS O-acetylase OafA/YrhL
MSGKSLAAVMIVLLFVSTLLKAYLFHITGSYLRPYAGTDCRVDELMCGALVALLVRSGVVAKVPTYVTAALALSLILFIVLATPQGPLLYYGGSTLFSILVAFSLMLLISDRHERLKTTIASTPLRWVGQISYGLYLWHLPVAVLVRDYGKLPSFAYQLIFPLLATGIACLSFLLVERPFLRIKDRCFEHSRAAIRPSPLVKPCEGVTWTSCS